MVDGKDLRPRVAGSLGPFGYEMVIVDNAENLQKEAFIDLKNLIAEQGITVVLCGTPDLDQLLEDYGLLEWFPHLYSFGSLNAPDLIATLNTIEKQYLRLPEAPRLSEGKNLQTLASKTHSHIGKLIQVIQEATLRALEKRFQKIDSDDVLEKVANKRGARYKPVAGEKCIWELGKFWLPKHTFQVATPCFGKRRVRINNQKVRDVYELLGQKQSPNIDDYLDFIDELGNDSKGNTLTQEDVSCTCEVMQLIDSNLRNERISQTLLQDLLLLTDDNLLLPPQQIFIPDAPIRLKSIGSDRSKIKLLHSAVPQSLASSLGSPSLQKDVMEVQDQESVQDSNKPSELECCRKWERLIKSPEFTEGLERLIFDEYGFKEIVNLDLSWLRNSRVLPATNIFTGLIFKGECIASNVPGNYYCNPEQNKFYLRSDVESIMRRYLAECLNNQLVEFGI